MDDYITCGPAGSDECLLNLQMLIDICKHLGVPLAEEKVGSSSFSGYSDRYHKRGASISRGEIGKITSANQSMASEGSMHEEETVVNCWSASACSVSCEAWESFS